MRLAKPRWAPVSGGWPNLGFTLIELLASVGLLLGLMVVLLAMVNQTQITVSRTSAKVEQFRESRRAFEAVVRRVGQATLNAYWDYAGDRYTRTSELRFIAGGMPSLMSGVSDGAGRVRPTHGIFFQAPLGFSEDQTAVPMESLLNTWGFFIEFSDEDKTSSARPKFIRDAVPGKGKFRYRLMELMEPSERLTLYQYTSGWNIWPRDRTAGTPRSAVYFTQPPLPGLTAPGGSSIGSGREWFTEPVAARDADDLPINYRVLAENIIALVILPQLSKSDENTLPSKPTVPGTALAPQYAYDSTALPSGSLSTAMKAALNPRHQLPPVVQITMVAIDERSAQRLESTGADRSIPPSEIQTLLDQLFDATKAKSAETYAADLKALETKLSDLRVNYRVFTSSVPIKAAKWSREQTN